MTPYIRIKRFGVYLFSPSTQFWWLMPVLVHYLLLLVATFLPYYTVIPKSLMAYESRSQLWFQWDSLWYIEIAQNGYETERGTAFFPLVPIMIKIVHNPYIFLFITQIGFLACLYFLKEFYKRLNLNDKQIQIAIWFFVLNPCSIFYSTLYTELWTVLFSLLSLQMAINGKWWYAALFAAILTSTRATALIYGIFPLVLFLYSLFKRDWKMVIRSFGWGLSCTIGLLCYMIFLWWKFGDPLLFSHVQGKYWGHYSIEPWMQLIQGVKDIQWDLRSPRQGVWLFTIIFTVLGLGGIWRIRSREKWETWGVILFVIISLLFNLSFGSQGPLLSTLRYLSVLFPIYAVMAVVLPNSIKVLVLFLSTKMAFVGAWGFIHNDWFQ